MAQKYRALRLEALQTDPEAFASSYEVEAGRGLDQTFDRLSNSKATQLVAVRDNLDNLTELPSEAAMQKLSSAPWLGMIVILGPEEGTSPSVVSARKPPHTQLARGGTGDGQGSAEARSGLNEPRRLRFHINAVFVTPEARRSGLGLALIDSALQEGWKHATSAGVGVQCSIIVNEENTSARKLYEKAGFRYTIKESYVQEQESHASESAGKERIALHMEYVA